MTLELAGLNTITQLETQNAITQPFLEKTSQSTTLIGKMQSLIVQFQQNKGQWITSNCQLIKEGNVHYYGIHKNQQSQTTLIETRQLYKELKSHILQYLDLPPDTNVMSTGCRRFRFF